MKRLLIATAVLATMSASCVKKESGVEPPPSAPEQMVVDPGTGRDMTAEYLQATLQEYYSSRDAIFEEARERVKKEDPKGVLADLMEKLKALQDHMDSAVKHIPRIGNVNLQEMFETDRKTLQTIVESNSEY